MLKFLRNIMKWPSLLALLATLALAQTGGPTKVNYPPGNVFQVGWGWSFDSTSVQTTTNVNTSGIAWYLVVWVPNGTVSGCTLTMDGSSGGVYSTGSLIPSQTCTSAGTYTTPAAVFSTSAKVTPTITGSGSLTVYIFGYVNNPAGGVASSVTVTNFPGPVVPILAGQQAVTASAVALPSHVLAKGVCVEALSTNTISVFVGPTGTTIATGIELAAGSSYCPPVSNSNAIFVVASTTGASVTWSGN